MFRNIFKVLTVLALSVAGRLAYGQSAQIQGLVRDPSGAGIPKAQIRVHDQQTGTERKTETNSVGEYAVPGLNPGVYMIYAQAQGFSTAVSNVITLNVAQNAVLDFHLQVGATSSEVTVDAGNITVNTTDASVSTVIDRQFVENLPLNGRSFQALLYMTPGVNLSVGAGSVGPNGAPSAGQFVVDGQRGDQSYWMIDGVSANLNAGASYYGILSGGSAGGTNGLGGTSSLVSVDALQEFRIETSTYAPEYGREMGGQISIQTRSGTNQFHGTLFDYLRNTDLDAEDWFADNQGLPKAAEIQNDFGGVVGGPIVKDKTFFFFSAEGLRLLLPTTYIGTVPDLASRAAAVPAIRPYFNAYPLPKPGAVDTAPGSGIVPYSATYSQPDKADAYSLRIDHQLLKNLNLFARYNHAPSQTIEQGGDGDTANGIYATPSITKTATVGATWAKSAQVVDDFRANYSVSGTLLTTSMNNFGGGTPLPNPQSLLPSPFTVQNSRILTLLLVGTPSYLTAGTDIANYQGHTNLVDSLSVQRGPHSLKFGADYRRLTPYAAFPQCLLFPLFYSMGSFEQGVSDATYLYYTLPATFLLHNLGVYGQDTWRVNSRLNLTYGLRWDIDFTPTPSSGTLNPVAITGFSTTNLSNLAIAPAGTPVYSTRYGNVAPRIGGAYRLLTDPDLGLVLRGGFGVFYGLASNWIGTVAYQSYPYTTIVTELDHPFPTPAPPRPAVAPPNATNGEALSGFDPHINLPYALEWNIALEQSLGKAQTFTLSYIGASDRRLLATESVTNPNPSYQYANLTGGTGASNYQALQTKFQRRLTNGLQSLISYTWSHSIDNGSYGAYANGTLASVNANRGDSDFDLRGVFTAALTYEPPVLKKNLLTRAITSGWSTDDIVQVRSGPPVDVQDTDPAFTALKAVNASVLIRPDVVPGQPEYLTGSQYPGRKALNPASFTNPPVDPESGLPLRQGDLGRNARRALGLTQWDFAAHREFPIYERLKLQFRAELFNVLNHPNFGPFNNSFLPNDGNPFFGESTQMLNQYLGGLQGSGTQNPLYTPGSPRSGELALKLVF